MVLPSNKKKCTKLLTLAACVAVAAIQVTSASTESPFRQVIVNDNSISHMVSGEHGAAAVENSQCSQVGLDVLKDGGSAVDSAIASALCVGVINSFATGIGGGGFMLIRQENGDYDFIDYRETAPKGASEDMYLGNATLSQIGGLAVGIPGEIRGFEMAHKKYGKLPWDKLFKSAIDIARNGFVTNALVHKRLLESQDWIINSPEWIEVFAPNGTMAEIGDIIKRPALATTLETIAKQGADAFYQGPIAESMVNAAAKQGGILTLADFENYSAISRPVVSTDYHGYKVFTTSAPTSGPALINILNMIEPFNFYKDGEPSILNMQRLVEAFKFGWAARTKMGDPAFLEDKDILDDIISKERAARIRPNITDDQTHEVMYYQPHFENSGHLGTMHLSVVDSEHSAVSLTSSVNLLFGSRIMDPTTGVILNNQQNDFSNPGQVNEFGLSPSPPNYVAPLKRPMSSMTPTIIENGEGGLHMVVGGSGGSEIITAVINAIINTIDFKMNLFDAVGAPRIHHQLMPNKVYYNEGFDQDILEGLRKLGHETSQLNLDGIFSAVQAILLHPNGTLDAVSDQRKFALAAAY